MLLTFQINTTRYNSDITLSPCIALGSSGNPGHNSWFMISRSKFETVTACTDREWFSYNA